jgi:outer membrane protein TolC
MAVFSGYFCLRGAPLVNLAFSFERIILGLYLAAAGTLMQMRFVQFTTVVVAILCGRFALAQQASQPEKALRLTLQQALNLARQNSVSYQLALTNAGVAREDKKQALATLLPGVNYNNSAIYTEGTGVNDTVKFIANNAVHEYISLANVHEAFDLAAVADFRSKGAAAAVARAQAEIASRGLVVTVVQSYWNLAAAQLKLDALQKAADEGEGFLKLTQDLEHGGEVAHADVIKAQLQVNDRRRQLQAARLALLNAHLDLAVLIFPNFNNNFEIADDLHAGLTMPSLEEFQKRSAQHNPEINAALEVVKETSFAVTSSRAGYLPSLGFDYFYGIDATHFATKTDGISNLGSSVVLTLNIPIWNWGSTQSKVKQAELRRAQAKRELSLSQRKLLAELQSLYAEAETASSDLASLSQSADLAAESLRLTTLRYKNGESTVLEVVDAQNTAASANGAYQDGALRFRVALANLQTLTGDLIIQ